MCHAIAKSYNSFTRNQLAGELVNKFILNLQKIANSCNFGDALDRMHRDHLIRWLLDTYVHWKLLAKTELALKDVEEAARAAEMEAIYV